MDTLGRVIEKKEELKSLVPNYSVYSEKDDAKSNVVLEIEIPGINEIYEILEIGIKPKEGHY